MNRPHSNIMFFFVPYSEQDTSTTTSQEQPGNESHELGSQPSSQVMSQSASASQAAGNDHEQDPIPEDFKGE